LCSIRRFGFFSASGRHVVSTTKADKLEVLENFRVPAIATAAIQSQLESFPLTLQPLRSIDHPIAYAQTFQAVGHAKSDVFSVGSMDHPRRVKIVDASQVVVAGSDAIQSLSGDAVTKVFTRLAFHPREDRLLLAGVSLRGRVVVFM
jgi:hypothetical protein